MVDTLVDRRIAAAATLLETNGRSIEDTIPLPEDDSAHVSVPLPHVPVEGAQSDFDLKGTLGEGGMGRVLLVRQRSLARDVAVKIVKDGASWRDHADLVREARISGALEHPGIVPVHALGADEAGRPLLVMKRVQGVDWEALLRAPEHPAWATVTSEAGDRLHANLEILERVCRALELAHSRGIIHRDVKPSNVMLGPFGEVYLVDWGIATDAGTRADALVGTARYMAPEMVVGEAVDARTDVFLLGAVLHRILVGTTRHSGVTIPEVLAAALSIEPYEYPASVPSDLAALANRATSARPEDRPPSVAAFREALMAFSRHRSAIVLSEVALERLDALEAMLDAAGKEAPAERVVAYRLATEARFGLMFCRRTYPEHAPARTGLERCLPLLVDLELRSGNIDAAVAVLDDLEHADEALEARVTAARAVATAKTREDERLRALDRDMDTSVARKGRVGLFAATTVGTVLLVASSLAFADWSSPTAHPLHVGYAAASLALVLVLAFAFRRQILANAFNRRSVAALFAISAMAVLGRVLAVAQSVPVNVMLTSELVAISGGCAVLAVVHLRRVAVVLLPLGAGMIVLLTTRLRAEAVFEGTLIAVYLASAWAASTGALAREPQRSVSSPPAA